MPRLIPPVVPPGRMRELGQPTLPIANDLMLRPWVPSDAPSVVEAFADPDIRYWHMRSVEDEHEANEWIAGWEQAWDNEVGGNWAIVRSSDADADADADADGAGEVEGRDLVLGQGGLRSVDFADGWAEITYWVVPEARGTGVATAAAKTLARWILDELGIERIELMHSTGNLASCRVAEKAGFTAEGTLRHAVLHADGWHDMHLHSRVVGDP